MTIATVASWSIGPVEVDLSPSTVAATAALARPLPIDAATSPAVVPRGSSFAEPSGSVIVTFAQLAHERAEVTGGRSAAAPRSVHAGVVRRPATREVDAEQRAELAQHVGRGRVVAAREDRVGELVERLERLRGVEVVVDRGAHPLRERRRVGTGRRAAAAASEPVQQRGAVLDVGVVPLEAGAVVVVHQREADRARDRRPSAGR